MKKFCPLLSLTLLAATLAADTRAADQPEVLLLWPNGAPGALGDEPKDKPQVTVYHAPADKAQGAAIVICPGGGYGALAMDHEGHQIARWLNELGVTGVILEYRHRRKGYGHPAPLTDAQRALRLVRSKAADWKIDPARSGVLGFSAGGHLASSACVHHESAQPDAKDPLDRVSSRPDFGILCYPVIAFDQPFTHRGSQKNLLGDDPAPELVERMSTERQVNKETPPVFLWATSEDKAVPPANAVVFYLALREHDIPAELHVFEKGRHGLGLARGHAAGAWPELCAKWLEERGVLKPQ